MLKPDFRSHKFNRLCNSIDNGLEKTFFKHGISPLLTSICSSFILIISRNDLVKSITILDQKYIDFINKNNILFILILTIILILFSTIRSYIKDWGRPRSCLTRDDVVSILDSFYQIVENKSQRFLANTKLCLENNWSPEEVFKKITVPDQQLMLLTKGVQGVFETLYKNEINFRVGLLRVTADNHLKWQSFYPRESPPKISMEKLEKPQSAVKSALQAKDLLIIEDIKKELDKPYDERRFVHESGRKIARSGSILIFPIYCPNTCQPIYALSILANANCLTENNRDLYEWILTHFKQRIILEHNLMIMKEVSSEKK